MVRHPKKDDKKTPEPGADPKDNAPEVARSAETGDPIKKGLDKLFWLRVGLGILAGTLTAIVGASFQHAHEKAYLGLGLLITFFIISYMIGKALRIPLLPSDNRKILTTGYGSYFMMFVFTWLLVTTLIHPEVGIHIIH